MTETAPAGPPPFAGFDEDALIASVDLIGRTGARELDFGYQHEDRPVAEADWWATAMYRGHRRTVEHHADPIAALDALARDLLTGARCQKCLGLVALGSGGAYAHPGLMFDGSTWTEEEIRAVPQCRWRRVGNRWTPGCEMGPRKSGSARKGKGKRKRGRR